jgi:hypothetical protein
LRAATRALVSVFVVTGLLVVAGQPAGAESVAVGWWSTAPAAAYPDAPADGLVVQGGTAADQPTAYTALATTITTGATAVSMTLTTAPNSVSTSGATLAVCPLTSQFTPVQGGSMANAPHFDCATKVTATLTPGTSVYTFAIGELVRDGALSVAILPTQPTDRVVFQRPGADAIRTTSAESVATGTPGSDVPPSSSTADTSLPAELVTPPGATSVFTDTSPAGAAPVNESGPAFPQNNAPAAPSLPSAQAPAFGNASLSGHGSSLLGVLFSGLILVALALWRLAGRRPAALFAADGAAPAAPIGEVAGPD